MQSLTRPIQKERYSKTPLSETALEDLRQKFHLQFNTVLELFAPHGSVPFSVFAKKFVDVTSNDFMEQFKVIKNIDADYAISNILENAWFPRHNCFLEYENHTEPVFIFHPKTSLEGKANPAEDGFSNHSETDQKIKLPTSLSTQYEHLTIRQKCPVQESSQPTWMFVDEKTRVRNKKIYMDFIKITTNKATKDVYVQKAARELAEQLWAPHLRFFSHIMYLLRQLSMKYPDGFNITNFEEEIEAVVPKSWKILREDISFELMLTGISDMMVLNLLMGCDGEDNRKIKVNKVVDYIGFHEVREHEVSMIYHYVSSSPYIKTVKSIHTFLCDDYPGWSNLHDEKSSMTRITQICNKNEKMFDPKPNGYCAKPHAYKIVVPMSFSLFLVYKKMGVSVTPL